MNVTLTNLVPDDVKTLQSAVGSHLRHLLDSYQNPPVTDDTVIDGEPYTIADLREDLLEELVSLNRIYKALHGTDYPNHVFAVRNMPNPMLMEEYNGPQSQ